MRASLDWSLRSTVRSMGTVFSQTIGSAEELYSGRGESQKITASFNYTITHRQLFELDVPHQQIQNYFFRNESMKSKARKLWSRSDPGRQSKGNGSSCAVPKFPDDRDAATEKLSVVRNSIVSAEYRTILTYFLMRWRLFHCFIAPHHRTRLEVAFWSRPPLFISIAQFIMFE